ncbi:Tetratricopeptide repeat-containing protein [Parapedobacter composti]|uniref:Tetratricopeptide repeat-containing protein n=1 Tax=Parapedobacter composti TaxID=623281 RepID=A0A1I1I5H4_9SPHI|nr:tetratricopeptide repeat protein [Parapedobacter composti]SFC31464.1 Tetratricopeptide repeat-containing protein [Parapedobacter composti]
MLRSFCLCVFLWCAGGALMAQEIVQPTASNEGDSLAIRDLYFKGLQQKSVGQLAAAKQTFERVVELQPGNDTAHFELARINFDGEDYLAAGRAAERAARINPDNVAYWILLLDIHKKTGNLKAMPPVFDALIRLEPDKADHYNDKAYALFLNKQYAASLAVLDTIAERFGETADYHLTKQQVYRAKGDTQSAIRELETLISKKPEGSNAYILLAELYTSTRSPKKALALLDEASRLFPDDPIVLLGKSDAYLATAKPKQAFECLSRAFQSDVLDIDAKAGVLYTAVSDSRKALPDKSLMDLADLLIEKYPRAEKAHAVRGDVYMQLQELETAREAYLQALDINKYIDGIWQQLLQVELQMGRYSEVESHGKEALALFPNHTLLLFFTGHGFLGNKNYPEARTYLEAALNNANEEHTPLLAQLYSNLGDVYNSLEMYAESDVAFEEAIALDSTNAYALNNYAYYLALRKEKLPLAAKLTKLSNELLPNYASYEDTYAWVLFQQGKYDEALLWIKKAVKNSAEPSETLLEHYGDILAKLGRIDAAVVQWKKAKAISESVGKDIDKLSKKINERQYID